MPCLKPYVEPMVFLPGWGFNGRVWSTVARHFDGARLLDLPCLPQINVTAVVAALSDHIPDQSVIVAWSLGGLIATELCYRLPHKCSKLILVSTTPKFSAANDWLGIDDEMVKAMRQRLKHDASGMMRHFFRLVQFPNRALNVRNYLNQYQWNIDLYNGWLSRYLALLFAADLRHDYSGISQPLLHVLGQADAVVKADSHALKKLNRHAVIESIEGSGHVPFITHHDTFMAIIKRFLNSDR